LKIGKTEKHLNTHTKNNKTACFVLLDSEDLTQKEAGQKAKLAEKNGATAIFVGGSTIADQIELDQIVTSIKKSVKIPIILFPGNVTGVTPKADAILFMSLINSENPYFITGAQAIGSIAVKKYNIEALPSAYLIVGEGGTTGFIGRAKGIPSNKPELAAMYALAAQYLGMRFLYLEGGSGVISHVPLNVIKAVRKAYDGYLIVGGGIKNAKTAQSIVKCGVDAIVVGTLTESKNYESNLKKIIKTLK
tara:strand:+ start:5677 stop:6420 length:744 start_codon:yes stop_codon:yes gene_type:complete